MGIGEIMTDETQKYLESLKTRKMPPGWKAPTGKPSVMETGTKPGRFESEECDDDMLVYPDEFKMGMKEELEHTDVVGDNKEDLKKIVLAHLKEDPKYYTKLGTVMKAEEDIKGPTPPIGPVKIPTDTEWKEARDYANKIKEKVMKTKSPLQAAETIMKGEEDQIKWTPKPPKPAPIPKVKQSPKEEIESFLHLHQAEEEKRKEWTIDSLAKKDKRPKIGDTESGYAPELDAPPLKAEEEEKGLMDKIKSTIKDLTVSPKVAPYQKPPPITKKNVRQNFQHSHGASQIIDDFLAEEERKPGGFSPYSKSDLAKQGEVLAWPTRSPNKPPKSEPPTKAVPPKGEISPQSKKPKERFTPAATKPAPTMSKKTTALHDLVKKMGTPSKVGVTPIKEHTIDIADKPLEKKTPMEHHASKSFVTKIAEALDPARREERVSTEKIWDEPESEQPSKLKPFKDGLKKAEEELSPQKLHEYKESPTPKEQVMKYRPEKDITFLLPQHKDIKEWASEIVEGFRAEERNILEKKTNAPDWLVHDMRKNKHDYKQPHWTETPERMMDKQQSNLPPMKAEEEEGIHQKRTIKQAPDYKMMPDMSIKRKMPSHLRHGPVKEDIGEGTGYIGEEEPEDHVNDKLNELYSFMTWILSQQNPQSKSYAQLKAQYDIERFAADVVIPKEDNRAKLQEWVTKMSKKPSSPKPSEHPSEVVKREFKVGKAEQEGEMEKPARFTAEPEEKK